MNTKQSAPETGHREGSLFFTLAILPKAREVPGDLQGLLADLGALVTLRS